MLPTRPQHIPEYAELCLEALSRNALGSKISLGGAFGLLHYFDYRHTHDVDAWWEASTTDDDRKRVIGVIRTALETVGDVRLRTWGDVVSVELVRGSKKIFTFQVAKRTVRLRPSKESPWSGILLDSFTDLVANKMVALVERGAPRDFRDIYALCQTDLTTPADCWRLWRKRQELAEADTDPERARLAVETHLARIVRYRPLDKIAGSAEREAAEDARAWYRKDLLDALMD